MGRFRLTVSVSNFVPKAFTPFQWEAQDSPSTFRDKHNYLSDKLKMKGVTFNYHDYETSAFEAVFARGDRKTSRLLYSAWKLGAKLDGWTEHYRPDIWEKAFGVRHRQGFLHHQEEILRRNPSLGHHRLRSDQVIPEERS